MPFLGEVFESLMGRPWRVLGTGDVLKRGAWCLHIFINDVMSFSQNTLLPPPDS